LRGQAWEWALAHRENDGSLLSGKAIAGKFGRHERWGRLVKEAGLAGEFADHHRTEPRMARATVAFTET